MTEFTSKQRCPRCEKFLNLKNYTPGNQGKKGSYCKPCTKSYNTDRWKKIWAEKTSDPDYVPGRRGRKPDPDTPLRQAIKKAQKNEQWVLTQEIWEVKKTLPETYDLKRAFRDKCRVLGVDFDEVWIAYTSGDKVCQICETPENGQRLAIDHDHVSGTFRGFLCSQCNWGLGALGDNVEGLRKALAYLEGRGH